MWAVETDICAAVSSLAFSFTCGIYIINYGIQGHYCEVHMDIDSKKKKKKNC